MLGDFCGWCLSYRIFREFVSFSSENEDGKWFNVLVMQGFRIVKKLEEGVLSVYIDSALCRNFCLGFSFSPAIAADYHRSFSFLLQMKAKRREIRGEGREAFR